MDKTIVQKAFEALYPDKRPPQLHLRYSGKFKSYNGTVKINKLFRTITSLEFSLSKKFLETEEEIRAGILQHLLNKVYNTKVHTLEQEFYHNFIKHMNRYAERKISDAYLEQLFIQLNEEYFSGLLDKPNLVFGQDSTTTMGHYNYATDTVTISTILKENEELLKFVLYHELLHKKHSFTTKNGRSAYHTKAFRTDEKKFKTPDVEKKLEQFVRKKKISRWF